MITIVRLLADLLDPAHRRQLARVVAMFVTTGVLQGLAFACVVPVLDAALSQDWDAATTWLGVLAGLFVAHHVALTVGNLDGYDLACDLLDITLARLGDHTVRLPLGWYDQDRTGQLSRMASKGATDIASVPGHLLRPLDRRGGPAPSPSSSRWRSWSGAWRSRSSSESSPCSPPPGSSRRSSAAAKAPTTPRWRRARRAWSSSRSTSRRCVSSAAPSTATSWSRTRCGSRSERRDGCW